MTATDLDTNKNIIRAFVAAWNDRDFDRFDAFMGAGAVLTVGGMKVPCDPKGTRAIAEEWTTAFPDWRFELLGVIARVDEMVIFRIADRKISEAWEVYDEAGMWRQLGVATRPT